MAQLTRHALTVGTRNATILSRTTNLLVVPARGTKVKKPPQKPPKKVATVHSVMSSIEAKGFLRPFEPYQPPKDAEDRVVKILQSENVDTADKTIIDDMDLRFKVFSKCGEELNYYIPNCMLADIETVGDLKTFYKTPVFTTTPFEALQNMELPPNLYVDQEYHRFHPDTDKMFGGKTAFPQSATLVTGLKYKDKYSGHKPEKPWPIKVHSLFDEQ